MFLTHHSNGLKTSRTEDVMAFGYLVLFVPHFHQCYRRHLTHKAGAPQGLLWNRGFHTHLAPLCVANTSSHEDFHLVLQRLLLFLSSTYKIFNFFLKHEHTFTCCYY